MKSKALFLDRDGIINIDHGYVYKKEEFDFIDGIFDICRLAIKNNFKIIVITNQSGIGRGMYTDKQFKILTEWMTSVFLENNIVITDTFYCPHHPTKAITPYLKKCNCRKPNSGMLIDASKKYNINLKDSIFIGDKISDMQAALNAGISNKILVSNQVKEHHDFNVNIVSNINQAKNFIF